MVKLTILNSMAGSDVYRSLDQHQAWGISVLDLKDGLFGKNVADLSQSEAETLREAIDERKLSVYCLSTHLFSDDLEKGEAHYRQTHLDKVGQILEIAGTLQPKYIRLLASRTSRWDEFADCTVYIVREHRWLLDYYREAVDQIAAAGFRTAIENELPQSILGRTNDILSFFAELDRSGSAMLTFDVQNLWSMGVFPTIEGYRALAPIIGYMHLKGGQAEESAASGPLKWSSSLEDASWPVLEMTRQSVLDGNSPVICLNPSHGAKKPGYNYDNVTKRDLDFIRNHIQGVE